MQADRRDRDVAQTFGVDVGTIEGLLLWYQQANDVTTGRLACMPHSWSLLWIVSLLTLHLPGFLAFCKGIFNSVDI